MIYLCGRYLQRKFDESSQETKLTAEYVPLLYSLALVIRWCIFLRYEELADFINSYLKFFRELNQSPQQQQPKTMLRKTTAAELEAKEDEETKLYCTKEKEHFFAFFMTAGLLVRWMDVLNAFTRLELDQWLTSSLPNSASSPIWQRALLIIPHVYTWWTNWSILNFTAVYVLTYMQATTLTVIFSK